MATNLVPISGIGSVPSFAEDHALKFAIQYWTRKTRRGLLLSIREKLRKENTPNVEFRTNYKDTWFANWTLMNGQQATANMTANGITVDDSSPFVAGSIVWNLTKNEQVLCKSDPSSSTVIPVTASTAVNGGSALSVNWDDNDVIVCLGNTLAESDASTSQIATDAAQLTNYRRYYQRTVSLTERGQSETLRTGDLLMERRFEAEQRIADDLDWGALHGKAFQSGYVTDTNTNQRRTMSTGIVQQIRNGVTNSLSPAANVNENVANLTVKLIRTQICDPALRYASSPLVICGVGFMNSILETIEKNSTTTINIGPTAVNSWGLTVRKLESSRGELDLMVFPAFDEMANGFYTNYGISLDLNDIWIRHAPGYSDLKFQELPKTNNRVDEWEYVTDEGYEIREPRKHAIFKITSVA